MNKLFACLALFFTLTIAATAYAENPKVKMQTSKGAVVIELYPEKAPKTVENFLRYVNADRYEGTIFHRVIKDFMNQGGGFTPEFRKVDTYAPIENEADNGLKNERGTIAMARTSAPHSATNQFFINTSDNTFLNHTSKTSRGWGYTVFGRVVDGMDVMDRIARVDTGAHGPFPKDVPEETILIEKVEVIGEEGE